MKRIILLLMLALFADVVCAYHPYAVCYSTGEVKHIGNIDYTKWHCSCGDNVWVPN